MTWVASWWSPVLFPRKGLRSVWAWWVSRGCEWAGCWPCFIGILHTPWHILRCSLVSRATSSFIQLVWWFVRFSDDHVWEGRGVSEWWVTSYQCRWWLLSFHPCTKCLPLWWLTTYWVLETQGERRWRQITGSRINSWKFSPSNRRGTNRRTTKKTRMWKRQMATNTKGEVLEVKMSQVDSLRDCPFYCSSLYT